MALNKITDLLGRFKKIKPPDKETKDCVVDYIKEKLKADLPKENISVKNNKIFIKAEPILKSEIFLNKEEILSLLKAKQGEKAPVDIR